VEALVSYGLRLMNEQAERHRLRFKAALWSTATVLTFAIGIIGALEVAPPWSGRAVIYVLVAMYVAFMAGQALERAHPADDQETRHESPS
jgi:hypothetical protein